MMTVKLSSIDVTQNEFSEAEIETLGEAMLKIEEMKKNKDLLNQVEIWMSKKAKKLNSIADLRRKANEKDLE